MLLDLSIVILVSSTLRPWTHVAMFWGHWKKTEIHFVYRRWSRVRHSRTFQSSIYARIRDDKLGWWRRSMRKRREGVSWMRVGDSFCQSAVLACFYHVLFLSSRLLCCSVFLFLNFIFGICILSSYWYLNRQKLTFISYILNFVFVSFQIIHIVDHIPKGCCQC